MQTNTHIPKTPSSHPSVGNTAAHPRTQSTFTHEKQSGHTISTTYYHQ